MKRVYIKWLPRTMTLEVEGETSHDVRIFDRTCGCGKWQNFKIPCSHAIKVLQGLHLNATSYIDPCYSLNNAIHTYSHNFVMPKSE